MGAMPVGVGLAWLGYALWSERRDLPIDAVTAAALPQQNLSQAASPAAIPTILMHREHDYGRSG